jgi:K(+)-stimulated pyrophosphate-energized sodium pump
MKSQQHMGVRAWLANSKKFVGSLILGSILSSSAFAAEGEGIKLAFAASDKIWLFISAGLGMMGIITALFIAKSVGKEPKGTEEMQEVSTAIEVGALAYLKQQIRMMIPFIILLAIGLYFLYKGLGAWAAGVSFAFIAGVISSYASGFIGMMMAVKANVRVAAAAMTSNKKALENAFRAGSVAGLMTVGVALFFSSIILILFPAKATVLLVGYGFGGSLAALFMRVGGGIFTKAADVGADLVGKVEAGIPEDSPKNPATIADNVGDNVGDCAGMAADVFESYEVMLVATIVLGAATSAVLDAQTWPKLIIFAMATCGFGILASLIAITMVKGDDNLDSDALKPILGKFRISAILSAIFTSILAFILLNGVSVQELITPQVANNRISKLIYKVQNDLAVKAGKKPAAVTAQEVFKDARIIAAGLKDEQFDLPTINKALQEDSSRALDERSLVGYEEVTPDMLAADDMFALRYVMLKAQDPNKVQDPSKPSAPEYVRIKDRFNSTVPGDKLVVAKLRVKANLPANGQTPAQKIDRIQYAGPVAASIMDAQLKQSNDQLKAQKIDGSLTEEGARIEVKLAYNHREDKFAFIAADGVANPEMLQLSREMVSFWRGSAEDVKSGKADETKFEVAATKVIAKAPWWKFAGAVIFGIIMAIIIEILTNYYVAANKRPTRDVANVATAGPAPMMIQGFAYACESSVFMVLAIVLALMVPLWLFSVATYGSMILSFYGIALVGLGLLTTTAYILAMDTFGPISDNAQGVYEMSGSSDNEYGATSLGRLDAAGNTTKALTKGFAIATAVVAAVALFQSFVESAHLENVGLRLDVPEIFLGLLIGAAAPFLFSAFTINAVGRSAFELINEVRRQFREDSGILAGTSKPDYARCVAIVTAAAQRELIGPGILAIALPVAVGFGFSLGKAPILVGGQLYNLAGAQALGGFLAGAIASGQLMAVLLSNSGGMWDNAKKIIEDGLHGGKGTDAHKASVVCDTVGDPFKDTAGPALNPLIKVMNLVALLIVGVIVTPESAGTMGIAVTVIAVLLLGYAFWRTKQGSLAESMNNMEK